MKHLLGMSFLLASLAFARAQAPVNVVATVNGQPITLEEVNAIVEARPMPVAVPKRVKSEMQEAAVEMLIDDLLMRQYLDKATVMPPAGEIDKEVAKLKEVLANQKKSVDDFLLETKQTVKQLRTDIATRLRWREYLTATLPEADMKRYYDTNKIFFDKVFVRASHVLMKVGATASPAEVQKTQEKLEYVRQQIAMGRISFEDAAKQYSECPSKDKGGDIGPFPYKFVVVPEFARVAFSMRKGDISNIVRTDFGLHLIKVTDRTDGEPTTFDGLKETVREVYAQDNEMYQKILQAQRQRADLKRIVRFLDSQ